MINAPSPSAKDKPIIAVFGAAGHTGRFVINELLQQGFTPVAIGRDQTRLAAARFSDSVETRIATVEDPHSLSRAFAEAALVINCAGPFLDTADAIVAAALEARIHYLGITAEQSSALMTHERHAVGARKASIILIPAMGFFGGLGDLMATATMGDWIEADCIDIAIAIDKWWPTPGTRSTGKRNTYQRVMIERGKQVALPDPLPERRWDFPAPFNSQDSIELPFSETAAIMSHLKPLSLHNYLNIVPLNDLTDPTTPSPSPVDDMGRSAQIFMMDTIARKGSESRRLTAQGKDIYAFTAPLVVEAAARILNNKIKKRGVLAPGAIFDAMDFLQSLAARNLGFTINISHVKPKANLS